MTNKQRERIISTYKSGEFDSKLSELVKRININENRMYIVKLKSLGLETFFILCSIVEDYLNKNLGKTCRLKPLSNKQDLYKYSNIFMEKYTDNNGDNDCVFQMLSVDEISLLESSITDSLVIIPVERNKCKKEELYCLVTVLDEISLKNRVVLFLK